LAECASELVGDGCSPEVAEELAIARFEPCEPDQPWLAATLASAKGDRVWARIATTISIGSAALLAIHSLASSPDVRVQGGALSGVMCCLLVAYGIAIRRAGSFAQTRATILAVVGIITVAALIRPEFAESRNTALNWPNSRSLIALSGESDVWSTGDSSRTLVAIVDQGPTPLTDPTLIPDEPEVSPFGFAAKLPTTAGFHDPDQSARILESPWIPDSARLSAVWLILSLVCQACLGWLRSVELAQTEGAPRLHI
jgi:hypothetical protein